MTTHRDLKKLVRARMRRTGENYTAARAALLRDNPQVRVAAGSASFEAARREQERAVARLFRDGELPRLPAKRKNMIAILLELLRHLEIGRSYPEAELNEILRHFHPDYAYLRRELVDYGYLTRSDGVYRVAAVAPERPAFMAAELPAWEREWLPGFLAGEHD